MQAFYPALAYAGAARASFVSGIFRRRWIVKCRHNHRLIPLLPSSIGSGSTVMAISWSEALRPRSLSLTQQQALYDHGRDLLGAASLSWQDDALSAEGPWLGHRTFTVSAQRLDHRLGRVDRLDYDIDLHPGRPLPKELGALATTLKAIDRRLRFSLDCR